VNRLVVLISGNGSNLQAVLDACASGRLDAKVALVISDRAQAKGLARAEKMYIPTLVKPPSAFQSISAYERDLAESIQSFQPDWIILAGWMRLLTRVFLDHFPLSVINLHPALPGAFPGTKAIDRAFTAFQKGDIAHTGVMVHLVPDEGVDNGPVLGQLNVPILPDDTIETLRKRIHDAEHQLLIDTLRGLVRPA
jgi:phosphoribosylglycinamide formyltransferase-1